MSRGTPDSIVRAAGAVVYRASKRKTEYLLVHRPRYDDWSLPKGTLDDGESYPVAALREVEEETGFVGRLGLAVGSIGYTIKKGPKVVRYWLIEADTGKFARNNEVDEIVWVSAEKALRLASYTRDTNVLMRAAELLAQPKSARVYLIRHANAGKRKKGDAADHDRSLSGRGRRQTAQLTRRLLRTPVSRVDSSYFARCEETVAPLASSLDLPIGHESSLVEGGAPEHTIDFLHSLHSDAAVLCSHGDIISAVVGQLSAEGVDFDSPLAWQKGSVWELDLVRGRVVSGRYTPPPS